MSALRHRITDNRFLPCHWEYRHAPVPTVRRAEPAIATKSTKRVWLYMWCKHKSMRARVSAGPRSMPCVGWVNMLCKHCMWSMYEQQTRAHTQRKRDARAHTRTSPRAMTRWHLRACAACSSSTVPPFVWRCHDYSTAQVLGTLVIE